jgi:hypothetical protein
LRTFLKVRGLFSGQQPEPGKVAEATASDSVTGGEAPTTENEMAIDIKALSEIGGFIGACLVDSDTGLMMASEGGGGMIDLEGAAAGNTEVVKAKRNAMKLLGLKDHIEDILISLGKQYHLIRPMEKAPAVFLYVALDRKSANLGMARVQVKNVEQSLSF